MAETRKAPVAPPAEDGVQLQLVEAVLMMEADTVSLAQLARITGLPENVVAGRVEQLRVDFARDGRGIEIVEIAGGVALVPKAILWPWLRSRYSKLAAGKLSRAAMETLSIVAYAQPITRSEIESIRGVSPDAMMRTLLERELIREVGKKDVPGRPVQYGTSSEFLRTFGLASIADLPKLDAADAAKFGSGAPVIAAVAEARD
jgi:segregation and condensation protein B